MNNVFEQIEKNIDDLVSNNADWTVSATKEEMDAARKGDLVLRFWEKEVPKQWLSDIKGKKVLCLAGAGGLQAPILACAGADVTVIDISDKMLDKDREIAKSENLSIEIVKGNMCDLSCFDDNTFDLVVNPPSLMYIPDLDIVFNEVYRVTKAGGEFIINGYMECQREDITELMFMVKASKART